MSHAPLAKRVLLRDEETGQWWSYGDLQASYATDDPQAVLPVLEQVERQVQAQGLYAAGFLGYEAAPGCDRALPSLPDTFLPLLYFGLFRSRETVILPEAEPGHDYAAWVLDESAAEHEQKLEQIHALIAAGDVYQINHTLRLRGRVDDPWALFLQIAEDARFGAYIETEAFSIVSASPESFFRLRGDEIVSSPMKGTAARQDHSEGDQAQQQWLSGSAKNRAENLMITDMVRNDLGRIAERGTVHADELFNVQAHPTVWQMTSAISAQTKAPLAEIFKHLFPAASITGAPKRAAMQHIAALERRPREVYTGAIGYLAPGRQAHFSIAIRTAWVRHDTGYAEYGAGGGIVWDSEPQEEYREVLMKTQILQNVQTDTGLGLFETLAWQPGEGLVHLDAHLERMAGSAAFFMLPFDRAAAKASLDQALTDNPLACGSRVRLSMAKDGHFQTVLAPAPTANAANSPAQADASPGQPVALAKTRVSPGNPYLHHKTTARAAYTQARAEVEAAFGQHTEPVLVNTGGDLTETDIANIVYRLKGRLYTPPERCGLLPGILRAELLEAGTIKERPLSKQELGKVEALYLINDLRGWRKAELKG